MLSDITRGLQAGKLQGGFHPMVLGLHQAYEFLPSFSLPSSLCKLCLKAGSPRSSKMSPAPSGFTPNRTQSWRGHYVSLEKGKLSHQPAVDTPSSLAKTVPYAPLNHCWKEECNQRSFIVPRYPLLSSFLWRTPRNFIWKHSQQARSHLPQLPCIPV